MILCVFHQIHIEECPSRGNFDRYVYSVATTDTPPARDPPPRQTFKQDDADEESWDHVNTFTLIIHSTICSHVLNLFWFHILVQHANLQSTKVRDECSGAAQPSLDDTIRAQEIR